MICHILLMSIGFDYYQELQVVDHPGEDFRTILALRQNLIKVQYGMVSVYPRY